MKVLILTDGKAGHQSQSVALALSLGMEYDLVAVRFRNRLAKFVSYLLDRMNIMCMGLFTCGNIPSSAGDYSFVAGTGSGTFYPVKVMARRIGLESRVIFYPRGYRTDTFGHIYAPCHDNPPARPNIEMIYGAYVFVSDRMKEDAVRAFRQLHLGNAGNAVSCVIGGPSRYSTMKVEWMRGRLDSIFQELSEWNREHPDDRCEAWVTTSRRTPYEIEQLVRSYPWDFCQIYSEDTYNPVLAFAVLSRKVYVTAESISMVSELRAGASGRVLLLDNLKPGNHKLRRFADTLHD
ncbi:MAG: mitochondrial fission ELM1 family protein [Bacteroidaceae bacterium]|nr:mitochondrial fission ELM1 family protein [Bacteroidaceae bacterium]